MDNQKFQMGSPLIKIIYFIVIIRTASTLLMNNSSNNTEERRNYRLEETVTPIRYEIEIKPYLLETNDPEKRFTFDGLTNITVRTKNKYVKMIVLHAKNLNISKTELILVSRSFRPNQNFHIETHSDVITDKLYLKLNESIEWNKNYVLRFTYSGKMENNSNGFYIRNYLNDNSEEKWLAATHFYPHHARTAFPCFDEPKLKAKFIIKINHENVYTSNSNTNISYSIPVVSEQRTIDIYKPTPIMSTYLVAFFISEFKRRIYKIDNLTIWARPEAFERTIFATDFAPKVLRYLDDYTQIPYNKMEGMENLDLVAIPNYDDSGMENWGLIILPESSLLYEPDDYGLSRKEEVALGVSHQIAHSWFGNLVTCDWWDYSWLNEGFAKYFEYFVASEILNDLELDQHFVIKELHEALDGDSTNETLPLTDIYDERPSYLNRLFEQIHYKKGGSIVRMISQVMGQDKFNRAMRKYLKENEYKTVTPDKLYHALFEFWNSHENVNFKKFLSDWTEQPGYPLVTVKLSKNGDAFKVSQKRFRTNGTEQWTIPFTYITSAEKSSLNTAPRAYLRKNIEENFELDKKADWILANIQQTGFYRVNYDKRTWRNLLKALKEENFSEIHEINRAQIIDDVIHFVEIGLLEYKFAFEVFEFLENEYSYTPWYSATSELLTILNKIDKKQKKMFKSYLHNLTRNAYNKLGFYKVVEDEKPSVVYTRNIIRHFACISGHIECISEAKKIFDNLISNQTESISPQLTYTVFCVTIREHGQNYSRYLWKLYEAENDFDKKLDYFTPQSCTKDWKEFTKLINYIFTDVPRQARRKIILSTFRNTDNIHLTLKYISDNYENVYRSFESRDDFIHVLENLSEFLSTPEQYKLFEKVIVSNRYDFDQDQIKVLNSALENIQLNIDWNKKHLTHFAQYIENDDTEEEDDEDNEPASVTPNAANSITYNFFIIWFVTFIMKFSSF